MGFGSVLRLNPAYGVILNFIMCNFRPYLPDQVKCALVTSRLDARTASLSGDGNSIKLALRLLLHKHQVLMTKAMITKNVLQMA